MSPSVTAAGVKLPLPSLYKPAAIAGNLNHFGIPTGYSSYGSSTVSYSGTPALVCSASNENLAAPDLKEKNVYSMHKQVWIFIPVSLFQLTSCLLLVDLNVAYYVNLS